MGRRSRRDPRAPRGARRVRFPRPAIEADRRTIRAGIAALEGRRADALALYRDALRAWRDLGLAWDEALCGLDMALLLDPADPDVLAECGRTVASRLPGSRNRPPELSVFDRPEVLKGTERYLPQSLLGYDFLNRGIMIDAMVEGKNLQIFRLLGTSAESASAAFDSYRSQLAQGKIEPGGKGALFLEGVDPLYGPVIVLKKGECLAGALKFIGKNGVRALLERVCTNTK